jgi:protein CpxP
VSGRHGTSILDLSAEQKASIKTIMTGAGPQLHSLHEQMHANALKLMQTQPSDPNYNTVATQVSQANATLHAQLTMQRAEVRAQVFKVLTPAQQQQLAALEAQREQRMAQHKGGFGPHGHGGPPPDNE